jgi:immune inhibitor A
MRTRFDEERCSKVAPHPDLHKKIQNEVEKLRGKASELIGNKIQIKDRTPIGMNDGLIFPGDYFPLGTPARVVRNAAGDRAPLRGSVRVVVVLAEFPDRKMVQTKQHFQDLFFSLGGLPNGSVREFYREVTNGLIDIIGEVVGPYKLPLKLTDYAHGASGTGAALPNARTMAKDAATASNADINFAPYDNDGNGFVDAFIVLHAGTGAETTGSVNDIWSHKWLLDGGAYDADGTKIYAYLTVPEDSKIGVCCHELGHLLFGFPDLYDTDYSSEGVGNWCLMGGGSWNGGGDIPAHPSAWCKANQGWVTVVNQMNNGTMNINEVKTARNVYRLWKDGAAGSEYFLLENRQQALYDRMLPGGGLLIWHVDESVASNSDENHPKVALEQADNHRDLELGHNRGDAGDPYPGSANNNAFSNLSAPSSKSYAGAETCVSVTSISVPGSVMTANVTVKCKAKEKDKDNKDIKDLRDRKHKEFKEKELKERKELVKERKDFKEKELKEKEKNPKEIREKGFVERPGGGIGGDRTGIQEYEGRIEALEARLDALEPFIDRALRPDLNESALCYEEDMGEMRSQMELRAAEAKRDFDTKVREY